ncbi:hypothetical protein Dacsa_3431 [Dactylococcopsis salina PCC 8305]|uniref:Transposase n=1 Tax=Dactylococcopsis salina (strain PCC 8305) TaxID=13035 RepID=K9Z026_DACS8|nr:hypothetical protein Dacsa_3431 [Dactylococcopsis salina PCC 8305]
MRKCLQKSLDIEAALKRRSRREKTSLIEELQTLPKNDRFRDDILEIVSNMIAILEVRRQEQETLEIEEREFLMQLSTVYTQRLEEAEQRGEQRAQRNIARNLLIQGMEIDRVAELTALSVEEVAKLRENPSND